MDRIKGKTLPPLLKRPTDDAAAPADTTRPPVPAPGRLVAAGNSMSASQREQNRQLIALYHAMRDVAGGQMTGDAAAELASSSIKGWRKRTRRQPPAKQCRGRTSADERTDGESDPDPSDRRQ